ncbi:MAG: hypothetical protein MJZ22_02270 [Candidatus Saccharibacteria bacterium]|nr:hypothetical protein [Candidatus Saccharibacteria bacterium]
MRKDLGVKPSLKKTSEQLKQIKKTTLLVALLTEKSTREAAQNHRAASEFFVR